MKNLVTALTAADSKVAQLNEAVTQAQAQFKQTSMPTPAELIQQRPDPVSCNTTGVTKTTDAGQAAAGTSSTGSGQAGVNKAGYNSSQAADVAAPTKSASYCNTATSIQE